MRRRGELDLRILRLAVGGPSAGPIRLLCERNKLKLAAPQRLESAVLRTVALAEFQVWTIPASGLPLALARTELRKARTVGLHADPVIVIEDIGHLVVVMDQIDALAAELDDEVMHELGYSDGEIADLRKRIVI